MGPLRTVGRPFRFLHDIVTEVNRETSFCEGLYDADEQNAAVQLQTPPAAAPRVAGARIKRTVVQQV